MPEKHTVPGNYASVSVPRWTVCSLHFLGDGVTLVALGFSLSFDMKRSQHYDTKETW